METAEKESLRHAVLECLVMRHPAALPVDGICRRVRSSVDFDFDRAEVGAALEFLAGLGLVRSQYDELGASNWWAATAQGVLAVERKGA